jgi:PAS domain S-box-containing protein
MKDLNMAVPESPPASPLPPMPWHRRAAAHWVPLLLLLGGWSVCGWFLAEAVQAERAQDRTDFRRLCTNAEAALSQRVVTYADTFRAAAGFIHSSRDIRREQWRSYAATLDLAGRYPGIHGVGVIYVVPHDSLETFIRATREDGAPDFQIHAPPGHQIGPGTHGIITFVEPDGLNHAALGLDVLAEPRRAAAARTAAATAAPQLTEPIALVQDQRGRPGALFFVPIYRTGPAPATARAREQALVGWVYAPIVMEELLAGSLGERSTKLRLWFFDGSNPDVPRLLWASDGSVPPATFERATTLELGARRFVAAWGRGPAFRTTRFSPRWWLPVAGGVASLLLAALVLSLQTSRTRAEALAWKRTRETEAAHATLAATMRLHAAVLDGATHAVISTTPEGTITVFNAGAERMLGYTRSEMVGGATPVLLHVAPEIEARRAELREQGQLAGPGFDTLVARARSRGVDEREWTFVRKDGTRLPVNLSVTALRGADGSITGYLGIAQDLTDRKRAEIALKASEERMGHVLAHAECLVWEASVELTPGDWSWRMTVYPSGLAQRLLDGRTPNQEAGLWYQFTIPERAAMNARSRVAMERGERGYVQEFRLVRDGVVIWIRESVAITPREPGCFWLVGVAIDITEQKRAESARAEWVERIERIGSQVPGLLFQLRVQPDGSVRFPYVSEGSRELFGLAPADLYADADRIFERVEPADRAELRQAMGRAATGVEAWRPAFRVRRADGAERWMQGNAVAQTEADGAIVWHGFITDVTEQRQAEERLRASLRQVANLQTALDAHAIVAATDATGTITYANDRFCAVSQYSREELIGANHRLIKSGRHPAEFYAAMWDTIAKGEIWSGEICNRAKDGSLYWVAATIVPFLDERGRPVEYIAVRTDITERKHLEERLAVARDQALEASRLKSEFLATMSHEIRTPMNAIIGMAGLLTDTALDAEQADMVQTVAAGAESLLTIINDILDFSRIEAGKLRLDPTEFDPARVLDETVALLAGRAHEKGLELTCDFEPPGCLLVGDAGRVRQILMNLVGNAVKFTTAGEVAVSAKVLAETAESVRIGFAVRDTGIGIPDEARARLFRPFVQVDGGTTRKFGGTGLGLAITQQLVAAMNGHVDFESVVGQGSTFRVELEFRRGGPLPAAPVEALPAGIRVLMVENHATSRSILLRQLRKAGCDAQCEPSATAALARLRREEQGWDVVLINSRLPGGTGQDLALQIRADEALEDLPLILLAAGVEPADPAAHFACCLTKPVPGAKLIRAIARALSERPALAAPVKPRRVPAPEGRRVLLVEDNLANQKVASMLLTKLGHRYVLEADGAAALDRLAAENFDVVLMDCQMPTMDGFEATRRIRSGRVPGIDPTIPVIALTAYAREEDRQRCLDAGMSTYISKPIRVRELELALEACGRRTPPNRPAAGGSEVLDEEVVASARALPGANGGSFLADLVQLYLKDDQPSLERIEQLAARRAMPQTADEAHGFAGNAAVLGALEVRRCALDVEQAARAGQWEEVDRRLPLMRSACARLRETLGQISVSPV